MNEDYREMMLRALDGGLDEEQQRAFTRALADDVELAAQWQNLQQLRQGLSQSRATAFKPFFSARVMQRIRAQEQESLADGLMWIFKPLIPVVAVAAMVLALSNWNEREILEADASVLEAVFSVAPITLEAAYAMEY
jgi:negative regulator of sigma E activity